MQLLGAIALFASLLMSGMAAAAPTKGSMPTERAVETLALQWFERMRTGQIDRTQLTTDFSARLTEDVVKKMSTYLNTYKYGASPTAAKILLTRTIGNQTFYDVKILFPRGDAASLLFSFDTEGKIAGLVLVSMAGD